MGLEAAVWWGLVDAGRGVRGAPAWGAQLSLRDRVPSCPVPICITLWLQPLPALSRPCSVGDARAAFWVG